MKLTENILHLLNIRKNEGWLVKHLFFLQFFQGAGVALFFTAANAIFLQRFPIEELPKVYLMAAVLLWFTGFLYSKLEHHLTVKTLIATVILLMATSVLVFRITISFCQNDMFLYLMLAWFYVLYLLGNLEFWGLSALLFDIRQSKRLFGIISAGDIPAKLIGYLSASLIVPYMGSANMLFIAMGSILMSLFFWNTLAKAGKLDLHIDHHAPAENDFSNPGLFKLVKDFFGSKLILAVAFLSFMVVTAATLINFSFYAEVKEKVHGDEQLAAFIGLFLASGRVVAIFLKLILTGKLAEAIGIKGSLLITPIALLFFSLAVIFSPMIMHNPTAILYTFGLMAILSETLKTSLQDPVFIAVMQPLRSSLRLKGHTIVKGVMDPFAMAFCGGLILLVLKFSGYTDLRVLTYILLVIIIVWIGWVFLVDKSYLESLVEGLKNRYISGKEVDLTNEATVALLASKMKNGEIGETVYLLHLIEKQQHQKSESLILQALEHPREEVKIEAVRIVEHLKIHTALPRLHEILKQQPSEKLLAETIQSICILQPDDTEDFSGYLESGELAVVKASVIGLLKNGSINAVVMAGQKLLLLIESTKESERKIAAEIIGVLRVKSFYRSLQKLMNDPQEEVVKASICATGKVGSEKLIPALLEKLQQNKFQKDIVNALYESGSMSLYPIHAFVLKEKISYNLRLKLIQTVAHIGGSDAILVLISWLNLFPDSSVDIYHALHLCEFRVDAKSKTLIEKRITTKINFALQLVGQLHFVETQPNTKVLQRALILEIEETRTKLMWLFSFVFDKEKMLHAKNGLQIQKKESVANALEIIDLTLPKEISSKFILLYEQTPLQEKWVSLKAFIKEVPIDVDMLTAQVLESKNFHYNNWTKAVVLYDMSKNFVKANQSMLSVLKDNDDKLIQETCIHSIQKLQQA